jgi:hypothetical protein
MPKYIHQHPILEHPQPMLLPQCDRPSFTPIKKHQTKITQEYIIHNRYACHLRSAITESTRRGYNFTLISSKFFCNDFFNKQNLQIFLFV